MSQKIIRKSRIFADNRRKDSQEKHEIKIQCKGSKIYFDLKSRDFEEVVEKQNQRQSFHNFFNRSELW